jgi:hypothetical protein
MNRTGAQFNRVSGRIETGSAVTAKVFTLGNSFELSGRDYYEKNHQNIQSIKENRLQSNDRRRKQASHRARAEKDRVVQNHRAHLASSSSSSGASTRKDRFGNARTAGPGPAPRSRSRLQQQQQQQQPKTQRPQQRSNVRSDAKRSHNNRVNPRRASHASSSKSARARPRSPPRSPLRSPTKHHRQHGDDGEDRPDLDGIGIVSSNKQQQHYDTRLALEERQAHQQRVSRAKNMQRGGEGDVGVRDDEGVWYTGRNAHKDPKDVKFKQRQRERTPTKQTVYHTQTKNTRKPDAYLNILLGKPNVDDAGVVLEDKEEQNHLVGEESYESKYNAVDHNSVAREGQLSEMGDLGDQDSMDAAFEQRANELKAKYMKNRNDYFPADDIRHGSAPYPSPSSMQKAMALDKELKRKKRLFDMENGLGAHKVGSPRTSPPVSARVDSHRTTPRSPRSPRSELDYLKHSQQNGHPTKGQRHGQSSSSSSMSRRSPKSALDKEPLARRIERRKAKEKQKLMDGNVTRLIRACKSVVVELQLCVWDWAKKPTFKSKDVARARRVKLRRTLHRLLDDHRHCVMELTLAVRNWTASRDRTTFLWNDEVDVLDLVRCLVVCVVWWW